MVNHDILLQKLDAYGIRGTADHWFVSYLKNRKQQVEIDCLDVTTDEIKQKQLEEKIIPKGSFLIYVNYIDSNISHDMGMKLTFFADDTSILITGKDIGFNFLA